VRSARPAPAQQKGDHRVGVDHRLGAPADRHPRIRAESSASALSRQGIRPLLIFVIFANLPVFAFREMPDAL